MIFIWYLCFLTTLLAVSKEACILRRSDERLPYFLTFCSLCRLCNIQNVTITESGDNGWNIDSIMTYGCTDEFGCQPLTQDIDVNRWVDGDGREEYLRFSLSKVSQNLCI